MTDDLEIKTKNLPPPEKKSRVERGFEEKLGEFELRLAKIKRNPSIAIWVPKTLEEFRGDWNEPGRFVTWINQSMDSPGGKHPHLAARLRPLLEKANLDPLVDLTKENKRLLALVETLTTQLSRLESTLRVMADELQRYDGVEINKRTNVISFYNGK